MMRVTSLNCNGIRAAARKGFFTWAAAEAADVICLQETRAQEHQLSPDAFSIPGYTAYFADAERRGYSGVAIYTRHVPQNVRGTCGWPEMDAEGRFIQADFGSLTVSSVYVPSGISGGAREALKLQFLRFLRAMLDELKGSGPNHIICADLNVAHTEIDIYDPVRNAGVTGFLPVERAWIDSMIESGWVDALRVVNPQPGQFTWWSNWPRSFALNLGWRIDYQLATASLAPTVRSATIYKEERFSDHAPLTIEYDFAMSS